MLYNAYTDARDFDYTKTTDDRNFAYSKERDAISDAQREREFNESVAEDQRQFDASLARAIAEAAAKNSQSSSSAKSSSSKSSSVSDSASSDAANALADAGYTPSQQKTIITMLESYKADYDNAAGNVEAQNYAVNLALAYLSGLEHQENNAYIFEKIFGFVPDELSDNDSKPDKSTSSGGVFRL